MVAGMGNIPPKQKVGFKEAPSEMSPLYEKAALMAEDQGDHIAAANHWGKAFEENPGNVRAAKQLAKSLRYLGAGMDSERVLREAINTSPGTKELQLELAKTLISNGNSKGAEDIIKAEFAGSSDIDVLQVHGIALDRQGRFEEAQKIYSQGASTSNPPASFLNNAGLSYALSGDLDQAEALLKRAVVAAGAGQQEKQNLALVLSLKGDLLEAERISQANLPQDIAQDTVRFYSEMVDQPDVWGNKI
jgi:Flp pilus assembly protein TadD